MKKSIKQAVVLAGGKSSRFEPFNQNQSKLEFNLLGKPLIIWTLENLAKTQIKQAVVIVGSHTPTLSQTIKKYQQQLSNLEIKLVKQPEPKGQADAILQASGLLEPRFIVINGSHFDADVFLSKIDSFKTQVGLFSQTTDQPGLYGILELNKKNQAVSLVEKPKEHSSPAQRVVSCYILSRQFVEFMKGFEQDEYLLESALNKWMKQSAVEVREINHASPSLKYVWHLLDIKDILLKKVKLEADPSAQISDTAQIKGEVYLGENAVIGDQAVVEGPVFIGDNALVGRFCTIRGGSVIEAEAEVQGYCDVNNSVVGRETHIHSGFVGDSVIGEDCRIGAGFTSANRRLDRDKISAQVKEKEVGTDRSRLGAIVGHQARIGINVSIMPGVIIKNKTKIFPGKIIS